MTKKTEAKSKEPTPEEVDRILGEQLKDLTNEIIRILEGIPDAKESTIAYRKAEASWTESYYNEEEDADPFYYWAKAMALHIMRDPEEMGFYDKDRDEYVRVPLKSYVSVSLDYEKEMTQILGLMEKQLNGTREYAKAYPILLELFEELDHTKSIGPFKQCPKGKELDKLAHLVRYIADNKINPEDQPKTPEEVAKEKKRIKAFFKELELLPFRKKTGKEKDLDPDLAQIEELTFSDLTPEERKPIYSGTLFPITSGPSTMDRLKPEKFQATFDPETGDYIGKETIGFGGKGSKAHPEDYDIIIKGEQRGTKGKPFNYTPQHKAILEAFVSIVLESKVRDKTTLKIPGKQILRKIGGGSEDDISKEAEEMVFKVMWEMKFTPYKVEWKVQHHPEKYPALMGKKTELISQFINVSITKIDGIYHYTPMFEKEIGFIPAPFFFEASQGLIYTHDTKLVDTRDLNGLNLTTRRGKPVSRLLNKKYVRFLKEQILGKLHFMETSQDRYRPGTLTHELNYRTLSNELLLEDTLEGRLKKIPKKLTKDQWDTFRDNVWIFLNFLKEKWNCFDKITEGTAPGSKEASKVIIYNIHLPKSKEMAFLEEPKESNIKRSGSDKQA